MADKMIVMKQGKVVDSGDREEILHNPKSDYTKNLLLAVPSLKGGAVCLKKKDLF